MRPLQSCVFGIAAIGVLSAACSGTTGETPPGGLLVASTPALLRVDVYPLRTEPLSIGAPLASISGAILHEIDLGLARSALAYSVPDPDFPLASLELGVFTPSGPVALTPDRTGRYALVGAVASDPPRIVWREFLAGELAFRSARVDGSAPSTIFVSGGCRASDYWFVQPGGLLVGCTQQVQPTTWYYSTGSSPAVQLPGDSRRQPVALTRGRAIFRRMGVVGGALTTQPLDGVSPEIALLPEPAGSGAEQRFLGLAGGRVLVERIVQEPAPARYELHAIDADGGRPALLSRTASGFSLLGVSPDARAVLALLIDKDGAGTNDEIWSFAIEPEGGSTRFTPDAPVPMNAKGGAFTADGHVIVNHEAEGWRLFRFDGVPVGSDAFAPTTFAIAGTRGAFVFLRDLGAPPRRFIAVATRDARVYVLAADAEDPSPAFRDEGSVMFADDNQTAWYAWYDARTAEWSKRAIDTGATLRVHLAGDGPGSLAFLVLTRAGPVPQDDVVVFDLADPTKPAVPLLSGPESEWGRFLSP